MGYNGNMAKTHENAHTPILGSTDIQFIQSADKNQYRANVSESSPQYAREKSQYGSPRQYARESVYQYAREILQYGKSSPICQRKNAIQGIGGVFQDFSICRMGRFWALFELPFSCFLRDLNAGRATWDNRTPDAGRQTGKILPVKPNPAQPLKLFLHLTLNAKNPAYAPLFVCCRNIFFLPAFYPAFISCFSVNHKIQKNAIHEKTYYNYNRRKNTIFSAKNHVNPQPQRKAGKHKKYLKKYLFYRIKSIDKINNNAIIIIGRRKKRKAQTTKKRKADKGSMTKKGVFENE